MLSDIVNVLKFLTESQTRDTIAAITQIASREQSNWKKNLHSMKQQFRISDWAKINAFTNDLFERVANTGISETKIHRFTTIYSELVDNAYSHGCKDNKKGKVTIQCIYSKWFIQLEVTDNGKGFDLEKTLNAVRNERTQLIRHGKSGLEIVIELSDKVEVKKSRVSVVIAGEDRIKILTSSEKLNYKDLLVVTVEEDNQWSFLFPSWEPLRETLEAATQPYVLVRFDKSFHVDLNDSEVTIKTRPETRVNTNSSIRQTKPRRTVIPIITEYALDKKHYFAYITRDRWVYNDLKRLEDNSDGIKNLRIFQNEGEAREWLKNC